MTTRSVVLLATLLVLPARAQDQFEEATRRLRRPASSICGRSSCPLCPGIAAPGPAAPRDRAGPREAARGARGGGERHCRQPDRGACLGALPRRPAGMRGLVAEALIGRAVVTGGGALLAPFSMTCVWILVTSRASALQRGKGRWSVSISLHCAPDGDVDRLCLGLDGSSRLNRQS
jgi:hypothetical protein